MKPEIKYTMIYPGNAVAQARHIYDNLPVKYRQAFLLHERSLPESIKGEVIKEFQSRQTMDINASELLGIGIVGTYLNFTGNENGRNFQSIVGIEDSSKNRKENYLSDGAIWEIEAEKKMMFQQTLVQGYYPDPHDVLAENVIKAINEKVEKKKRGDYSEQSGLIVNVFSRSTALDLSEIVKECDIDVFGSTYIIFYSMPDLSKAIIYYLRKGDSPFEIEQLKMNLNLSQFNEDPDWTMNTDKSKWIQ